jgi:hypothetical protein
LHAADDGPWAYALSNDLPVLNRWRDASNITDRLRAEHVLERSTRLD